MPIEGIGSAVEKAAPLVKFPILMRIVFPGTFAALCTYPFDHRWVSFLPIPVLSAEWSGIVSVAGTVCILGALVSGLRGLTYKIYSDRLLWPPWLFRKLREIQESRVQQLLVDQEELSRDTARFDEIWQTLLFYPVDHAGNPYASHPTLLGNIITAYETYPMTRYGMPSVFYWPRILLLLEKEKKEEIDASWSMADGLLSLSAVAFVGGLSWAVVAITELFGLRLPIGRFPLVS